MPYEERWASLLNDEMPHEERPQPSYTPHNTLASSLTHEMNPQEISQVKPLTPKILNKYLQSLVAIQILFWRLNNGEVMKIKIAWWQSSWNTHQ